MIWRLLSKNISMAQMAGYAVANVVGLTLVLCAIAFYGDVSPAVKGDSLGQDYMVISRSVSMLSALGIGGGGSSISEQEIARLRQQPWVEDVGEFTSADFGVSASVDFGGRSMWTYLFLESVPDSFMDIMPDGWKFMPSDTAAVVPIVISRDYLALYNFGFASSRGLPQLSESLITQIPLSLYVNGNGRSAHLNARIAGFSNRLNTIAVPQAFMQWANAEYGDGKTAPSRLVVKVSDPGDPSISSFLEDNGYEVAGEGMRDGKVRYMLTLLTAVVAVVGIVICALALLIIMLNITILMQKNKEKNRSLMMLGYSPTRIEACYVRLVVVVNSIVLAASVALMMVLSGLWRSRLEQIGIDANSCVPAILSGIAIIGLITMANCMSIRRAVRNTFFIE